MMTLNELHIHLAEVRSELERAQNAEPALRAAKIELAVLGAAMWGARFAWAERQAAESIELERLERLLGLAIVVQVAA